MASPWMPYMLALGIVFAIWLPVFIVLWVLTALRIRRQNDPARSAFSWLHGVLPAGIIAAILQIVWLAYEVKFLNFIEGTWVLVTPSNEEYRHLIQVLNDLGLAQYFFSRFTDALVVVLLVELGSGFMCARSGRRAVWQTVLRFVAIAGAIVLTAMAIGYVAYSASIRSKTGSIEGGDALREYMAGLATLNNLRFALDLLFFLASLATLAYAIAVVVILSKSQSDVGATVIFLVGTLFFAVRNAYLFAYSAETRLNQDLFDDTSENELKRTYILWTVFDSFMFGIPTLFVVIIGLNKVGRLWSPKAPAGQSAVKQERALGV